MKSSFLLTVLLTSLSAGAYAAQGDPIVNNNYRLDLTRTVATGSTRKIAMGGAFVGLAEGNAAIPDNPAAVAYRPRAFQNPWEFDMVLGTLVTTDDDTDNSGSSGLIYGDTSLMDAGLMAQHKNWGLGGVGQFTLVSSDDLPQNQEAQFLSGTFALGYTALDQQLAFGFSMNPVGARVHTKDDIRGQDSFKLKGLGWGTGVIWHPGRRHWRFGGAYSSAVSTNQNLVQTSTSPVTSGNLIVPGGVLVTDSLALGTAYEWNDLPFWHGHPTIGTFDLKIFGASPADANSTDAFISQSSRPQGQKTIVTLHTGAEVEAIPRYLRLRAGTYYEPSRFEGVSARQHITGGFEVRVTKFNIWGERPLGFSYAIDSAARYLVQSFSIWLWTFTVPVPDASK